MRLALFGFGFLVLIALWYGCSVPLSGVSHFMTQMSTGSKSCDMVDGVCVKEDK